MRFILIIFLLASFTNKGNSQGELITSCPDNFDHILCEDWVNNLFTSSDAWCTNSPGVTEYEIGYYISPTYLDQVFYYEKLTCCDTEGIDPCEYRFYNCSGSKVETYIPESFGPFGGPAMLDTEYFQEFGSNIGGVNVPTDDLIGMFIEDENIYPNCDNVNISDSRDFCLINPNYIVTTDISYVCGVDGNIYENSSMASTCYGISVASDPSDCNFICNNGSVEAGEEEDGCGGDFCPSCDDIMSCSNPDSTLCQTWLSTIIYNSTCDFSNSQNYNFFKIYSVPFQGDTAVLFYKEQFIISDGSKEFTLFSCAGDTLYECSQGVTGTCNDLPSDPVLGPIINDTLLIFDCRVDQLDCPNNNPFTTVQTITVDQGATGLLPSYTGCDAIASNTVYLTTESVFTFMLFDNLDFPMNTNLSVDIFSNNSIVKSTTFQDTVLASTSCVWGWWDAEMFSAGDYVVRHYVEDTYTQIKYLVGESNFSVIEPNTQLPFVTTWKTDNDGTSCSSCITIPTFPGETYSYDVDWENDGTYDEFGLTGDAMHTYSSAGNYTVAIRGTFPRIYFNNEGDKEKIINIGQWGEIEWSSMVNAFMGCSNLNSDALDNPDLSNVTNLERMFNLASTFNGNIDNWDVSNITDMSRMFYGASSFNQDISSWNVSNVTNMRGMFRIADSFNQDISGWDISNVSSMWFMFYDTDSFNQDLSSWDVSNVTSLRKMFEDAKAFNQSLDDWELNPSVDLSFLFDNSSVDCINYSATLEGWAANNNTPDNLTLGAQGMEYSSNTNSARNTLIAKGWTIDGDTEGSCGVSSACASTTDSILCYDWLNQIITNTSFCTDPGPSAIIFKVYTTEYNGAPAILVDENINCINPTAFGAGFTLYDCDGTQIETCSYQGIETCSNPPIDNAIIGPAYTIATLIYDSEVDALPVCDIQRPFITTWKTDNSGTSCSSCITIPTLGSGYNYDVDWNDDGVFDEFGITGDVTHDFIISGTYTIRLRGEFPWIYFNDQDDKEKIINIDQWGDIEWTSMSSAFRGCENLLSDAQDSPNLNNVTSLFSMFRKATQFNTNISDWDVSNIIDMDWMFALATSFNQDISNWNVSNVEDMRYMFFGADSFNQDISKWNVCNVQNMSNMFGQADNFNQNLGDWDLKSISGMSDMLDVSGVDCENYTSTLIGWAANGNIPNDVTFGALSMEYDISAAAARNQLIAKGWNIIGDSQGSCPNTTNPFVTTWKTDNDGTSCSSCITIPTFSGETYSYDVDWDNDGIYDEFGLTNDATHDYTTAGTYTVAIRGDFPRIYFNNNGDRQKLLNIGQWGEIEWSSMESAFMGCENLNSNASDAPDLSSVTTMLNMFRSAFSFDHSLDNWDVSNVTITSFMFAWASSFDQSLNNWNVSSVTAMNNMFANATSFNQSLNNWNVGNVDNMGSMFSNAESFDQSIESWNVQNVSDMGFMFRGATAFNQNLASLNLSSISELNNMLDNSGLDCENYSATLTGWAANSNTPNNLTLGAQGMEYGSTVIPARDQLIAKGWTINGDSEGDCLNDERPFITTWKTDNPGTSCNSCITIPTFPGETYNYDVDWDNDGVYDEFGINGDVTYDFTTAGTYTVAIKGDFPRIYFNFGGEKEKIININQWGDIEWSNMEDAFNGCSNINSNAADMPDLSNVTDMSSMFRFATSFDHDIGNWDVSNVSNMEEFLSGADSFNQDISAWDVSNVSNMAWMFSFTDIFDQDISSWNVGNVTNMYHMFWNSNAFNQDIGSWDVSNVEDLYGIFENAVGFNQSLSTWNLMSAIELNKMLDNSGIDCTNYTSTLQGWAANNNTPVGLTLGAEGMQFDQSAVVSRDELINNLGWTINGDSQGDCLNDERPFITSWKTDNPGTSCNSCITIPTFLGQFYDYDIDWDNDGVYDEFGLSGSETHDYQTAGTYKVAIRGNFRRIYFNGGGDNEKIINIDQWGDLSWNNMDYAFAGCINLNSDATDVPDLSSVTSMSNMFSSAQVFNGDVTNWDVSNIGDMSGMFQLAYAFNGNVSQWDVSNVSDMRIMFSSLTDFNSDLSNWDVGSVTNMSGMFQGTDAFNSDLSAWDVSEVTSMSFMFSDAISFDQPLGSWDLSSVSSLTSMLNSSALSCENYTNSLQGWAANNSTPTGRELGAQNIEYGSEAKDARDSLINILGWTISGDVDLGKECNECGPGSCLLDNPPVWIDTQLLPDITITCVSNIPDIAGLVYSNGQSEDCLIIGNVSADRDETNFDGCSGTIIETWNYTTICGVEIEPYTRTITISSQGSLVFDVTPEATVTISCSDIDLYDITLDYMLDQGDNCIPSGSVDPIIINNYDACGGTVTYTWTVNESCYGSIEFTQTASILPNDNYQYSELPKDLIIECDDLPFIPDTLIVSNGIEGNCAASEQIIAVSNPKSQDCPGTITNTWVYINPCSNEQLIHVQNITLVDCAPPLLEEDYLEVRADNIYNINLFDNDDLPDSFSTRVMEFENEDLFTSSRLDQDGYFEFEVRESFFDTLRVPYEVCNLECDICTTAFFKIVDEALKDIFLSDIITPDGDGMNDALKFNFETEINSVQLFIYNRWGNKIYEKLNYTNDWNASGLPGGIYYYVLKVGKAEVKKTLTVVK